MPSRPNFVLIMPDQLRADAVFGPPGTRARTPNLDRLAAEGVSFTNCFVQYPACTPSRCSMFTGLYPHTLGHRHMHYLLHGHERNMFQDLKEAGYRSISIGKNDFVTGPAIANSFDSIDWLVLPEDPPHSVRENELSDRCLGAFYGGCLGDTDVKDWDWACTESALQFLDQEQDPESPFCLVMPLGLPHPPYDVAEPFYSMHDRGKVPLPIPPESSGARSYRDRIRESEDLALSRLTEDDYREIKATYFGMVSRIDHQFGQIMAKLRERDLLDNTVVVVLTDHGDYTGDYGLTEKWHSGFEECLVHTPLYVRVPGGPQGLTRQALVEMTDLYPTILELAGVEPKHQHFGKSLVPLCGAGTPDLHRAVVFCEGGFNRDETHSYVPSSGKHFYPMLGRVGHEHPETRARAVMVRTRQYKYVYCPEDRDELYDLEADPQELTNVVEHEDMQSVADRHRDMLLEWLVRTSDIVPFEKDGRGFYGHNQHPDIEEMRRKRESTLRGEAKGECGRRDCRRVYTTGLPGS